MTAPHYVKFFHGLGDCSNFALLVRTYRAHGIDLRVVCDDNKRLFFAAAGVPTVAPTDPAAATASAHPWWEPGSISQITHKNILEQNKTWRNFKSNDLPTIDAQMDVLWPDMLKNRDQSIFDAYQAPVAEIIQELPRPIVLIHANGNTSPGHKDLSANFTREFNNLFLTHTDGSLIFLDWDNRTNWIHSSRARHINTHYAQQLTKPENLMGLIAYADLLVGIDSGPFHLAGMVDAPSIGIWFDHHPLRYAIPRKNCLNIVTKNKTVNLWGAVDFNIVTQEKLTADYLLDVSLKMLAEPVYRLPAGEDVQLQLLVEKCAGGIAQNTQHVPNCVVDRHRSFSFVFDYLSSLKRAPLIVETGCIRADNDWTGAGYSTFLFGLFAARFGGSLHSIDLTEKNITYAKNVCAMLPNVFFHQTDSVTALEQFPYAADLIYLDSMDANIPGHAEHGLKEAQQSVKKVKQDGLIVFDDTVNDGGRFLGKGALGVPWLLENGWQILFMGHQIVLKRT